MQRKAAVIGAGVSGLTCGVVLKEAGWKVTIFADEIGQGTTSAAAAAIWFPYDAEPLDRVIPWALASYKVFQELCHDQLSGVSMTDQRVFVRTGKIALPEWVTALGGHMLHRARGESGNSFPEMFSDGFTVPVPLIDTSIYLPYLEKRFLTAGGTLRIGIRYDSIGQLDEEYHVIVNCAGIGARRLVPDPELEPHRGQVAIVRKLNLNCAIVCDEPPLLYVIPRTNDCVFGGTNSISDDVNVNPADTEQIIYECCRVLDITSPKVLAERVGLRPFRKSGVRLEAEHLANHLLLIHNYGHGGAGFTLSWGCAEQVLTLVREQESN